MLNFSCLYVCVPTCLCVHYLHARGQKKVTDPFQLGHRLWLMALTPTSCFRCTLYVYCVYACVDLCSFTIYRLSPQCSDQSPELLYPCKPHSGVLPATVPPLHSSWQPTLCSPALQCSPNGIAQYGTEGGQSESILPIEIRPSGCMYL